MQTFSLKRAKQGCAQFSVGLSTWYDWLGRGLLPPAISLGARSVAWPQHELDALAAARIAGKSEDEIRALCRELVEARAQAGKLAA
jgi:prophage regulatory protein